MNKLPNDYQNFIALSRYARWLPEKNRRESWEETVTRYFDFLEMHLAENTEYTLTNSTRKELDNSSCLLFQMIAEKKIKTNLSKIYKFRSLGIYILVASDVTLAFPKF